jgi:hypothetical protein
VCRARCFGFLARLEQTLNSSPVSNLMVSKIVFLVWIPVCRILCVIADVLGFLGQF